MLRDGKLDDREVELDVTDDSDPLMSVLGGQPGMEETALNGLQGHARLVRPQDEAPEDEGAGRVAHADRGGGRQADRRRGRDARSVRRAENAGIVFIDEIDKIAGSRERGGGADVSREGVQRDLLPIVEGSTVTTKYGPVKTDHMLFIAAGAFHTRKPSDLIPELQGRFPIRVELEPLTAGDFVRILTEPKNALTRQYAALLATEGITIEWADAAIRELASIAADVNRRTQTSARAACTPCSSACSTTCCTTRPTSARRPSRSRRTTCASGSARSSPTKI